MPKTFLLCTLITLVILHAEFGLIWTTPCPDEKEFFFKFLKIRTTRNSQISVCKPNFFSRQAKPNTLFAVHSQYIGDTQYRVWFDLDNSLTRWKRPIFKIPFSRNLKSSVWKPIFFLGKLYRQIFCITLSLHWWYSIPSLVWFGQLHDPMKKNFFKIRENSQFEKIAKFRMKTQVFLGKLYQQLFCNTLSLHCWYSMPSLVWFG